MAGTNSTGATNVGCDEKTIQSKHLNSDTERLQKQHCSGSAQQPGPLLARGAQLSASEIQLYDNHNPLWWKVARGAPVSGLIGTEVPTPGP